MTDRAPDPARLLRIGRGDADVPILDHAFSGDSPHPTTRPGATDDSATGWPAVHPGPLNASTGFQELSASVVFTLDAIPPDVELELRGRGASGPCPDLRVEINGVRGLALTRQVRDDRAHDPSPPSPTAGLIHRRLGIPTEALRLGENTLTITTITVDAVDPDEQVPYFRPDLGSWFGSTLNWDEITLWARAAPQPRIVVEPLPLYVREGGSEGESEGLAELVDVVIENAGALAGAVLEVSGAAEFRAEPDAAEYAFGDLHRRLSVPDSAEPFRLQVAFRSREVQIDDERMHDPARKWTIHLFPHVHLDVGYTDRPARVRELHNRNIDKALAIIRDDPDYRFALDGAILADDYSRSRGTARVEELWAAARAGTISINPFYADLLTGVADLEDLYRSLYYAAGLAREQGVPFGYANVTDVPTYSQAIPSVLAAAGVSTFLAMSDHIRGGNADSDELHLASPVRWRGPDGAEVVTFFSDCYTQMRFVCADPPTTPGLARGLSELLRRYERADYLPTHFPLVGTNSDNEDLAGGYADLPRRWAESYEWPKIRFSTPAEYFAEIEPLADRLPVVTGDGGGYWEDGVGTQAIATATNRRSQALLPAVETVSSLAASLTDGTVPDLGSLDRAWTAVVLGSEHTWAADLSTIAPNAAKGKEILDWTVDVIDAGARLAGDELHRAASQLADRVQMAGIPGLLLFNALSWERALTVDLDLPADRELETPEGERVALHSLEEPANGIHRVRVRVPGVPAFGYVMLRVVPTSPDEGAAGPGDEAQAAAKLLRTIGTEHYVVDLDDETGAIRSLWSKALDREVVDPDARFTLGDVVYVTEADSPEALSPELTSISGYDPRLPLPVLQEVAAELRLESVQRTPWSWLVRRSGAGPHLPRIEVELELHDDSPAVDVRVRFDKTDNVGKESVYVVFPFQVQNPRVEYDRQQGWVDPQTGHYAGACNEWLITQNAVIVEGDDGAVEWCASEAPLFTSSDIVRSNWPTAFAPTNGHLYSWVMNNYWHTNVAATQSGTMETGYTFTPRAAADRARAWRAGRAFRVPAVSSFVIQNDRAVGLDRPLPPRGQLLDVRADDDVVVSVLAGRTDSELTLRVRETGGRGGTARIRYPETLAASGPERAVLLTATEDVVRELPVTDSDVAVTVPANGVVTVGLGRHPV